MAFAKKKCIAWLGDDDPIKFNKDSAMNAFRAIGLCALVSLTTTPATAGMIEFEEFGLFAHASGWSHSAEDFQVKFEDSTFNSVGLDVTFTNDLLSDNTGSVTWRVTNESGSSYSDFNLFGYLNADIGFAENGFYNEYAEYRGNTEANAYEIDEPGYTYGDIYDNLLSGNLDNSSSLSASSVEDTSFALGFYVGELSAGDWVESTWTISRTDIGGIEHIDPDSSDSFFFNGSVFHSATAVAEPHTLWLLSIGLPALLVLRRKYA